MLRYVVAAVIAVWFTIGLLALCDCVVGGRAERRRLPLASEGPDRQRGRSRTLRAAMF